MITTSLRKHKKLLATVVVSLFAMTSSQTLYAYAQLSATTNSEKALAHAEPSILLVQKQGKLFFQKLKSHLEGCQDLDETQCQIAQLADCVLSTNTMVDFQDCASAALYASKVPGNARLNDLAVEMLTDLMLISDYLSDRGGRDEYAQEPEKRFVQLINVCGGNVETLTVGNIKCKNEPPLQVDCSINIPAGSKYFIDGVEVGGPTVVGALDMNGNYIINVDELCVTGSVVADLVEAKMTGTVRFASNVCIDSAFTLSVNAIAPKTGEDVCLTGTLQTDTIKSKTEEYVKFLNASGVPVAELGGDPASAGTNVGRLELIDTAAGCGAWMSANGSLRLWGIGQSFFNPAILLAETGGTASLTLTSGTNTGALLSASTTGGTLGLSSAGSAQQRMRLRGGGLGTVPGPRITLAAIGAGVSDTIGNANNRAILNVNASSVGELFLRNSTGANTVELRGVGIAGNTGGEVGVSNAAGGRTVTLSGFSGAGFALVGFFAVSDDRAKTQEASVSTQDILDKILTLTVRTFKWEEDFIGTSTQDQQQVVGLIGQELITVFPEFVDTSRTATINGVYISDFHAVEYGQMSTVAIAGIQALDKRFSSTTGTTTFARDVQIDGNLNVDGAFTNPSDARVKEEVADISPADSLGIISKLQAKTYKFTPEFAGVALDEQPTQIGFVAQDVQKVMPEVVHHSAQKVFNDFLAIDYSRMVVHTANAAKALKEELDAVKAQRAADQQKFDDFAAFATAQIEALQEQLASLQK